MSTLDVKDSRHELIRGSSSENSTDTSFLMLDTDYKMNNSSHEYASPQELQNEIKRHNDTLDGVKKRNLIYEPLTTPTRHHKIPDKTENCSYNHQHDRLYKLTLVVIVLFSLAAFLLSLLTSFGLINTKTCLCDREIEETTFPVTSGQSKEKTLKKFYELERNLSVITSQIIPGLLAKIKKLESRNTSVEGKQGPPGPQGPEGKQGPPGVGDLSKCRYKSKTIASAFKFADQIEKEKIDTQWVSPSQGYTILGAACTTMGGSQAGLFQKDNLGTPTFSCKCAGRTKNVAFSDSSLLCRIHYWECPTTS